MNSTSFLDAGKVDFLNNLPIPTAIVSPSGRFLWTNDSLLQLSGYRKEELLAVSKKDVLMALTAAPEYQQATLYPNQKIANEFIFQKKDGSTAILVENLTAVMWEDQPANLETYTDVTAQSMATTESVKQYAEIIESAADIMFTCDFKGKFLYSNSVANKLLGYSPNELLSMSYLDIVAPFARKEVQAFYEDVFKQRKEYSSLEFAIVTKEGKELWLHQKMTTLWDQDKKWITGYTAVCRDVTKRVEATQKLKESEEIVTTILKGLQELIFIADRNTLSIYDSNDFGVLKLGTTHDEIKGRKVFEFESKNATSRITAVLSGNYQLPIKFESLWTDAEGQDFSVYVNVTEIELKARKLLLFAVSDISNQIALKVENERFQAAIQEAPFGIYIVELDSGKIIDVNTTKAKRLGYTKDEMLQLNISDIDDNDLLKDRKRRIKHFLKSKKSEHFTVESKHIRKDGSRIPVRMVASIKNLDGKFHLIASVQDITKELERELKLVEQNQVLNIIKQLQNDFITKENITKQFNTFLDSLIIFTKSSFGFMGELMHNEEGVPYLKTHCISDVSWNQELDHLFESDENGGYYFNALNTLFGNCLLSGEHVVSNDPKSDARSMGKFQNSGIDSFIGVPVKIEDRLIGMIGLANKPGGYSYNEIEGLEPFVSTYAVMIEAVRTDREKSETERDLQDKETLLKEIHHRVKNNMQVISSMLTLTFKKFGEEVRTALEDSNSRINTVALVHEQLYETKNLKELKSMPFIKSLLDHLRTIYSGESNVNVAFDVQDVPLDIDKAIPMGLIINEVISNSFKYAFNNHSSPQIAISFQKSNNLITLTLADNGTEKIAIESMMNSKSLGLKLIGSLAKQLRSQMRIDNEDGLKYEFTWTY